jgi:hypothetical protein
MAHGIAVRSADNPENLGDALSGKVDGAHSISAGIRPNA